jgi:hypothetical protein
MFWETKRPGVTERYIPTVAKDLESGIINAGGYCTPTSLGASTRAGTRDRIYTPILGSLAKMPTCQEHGAETRRLESLVEVLI